MDWLAALRDRAVRLITCGRTDRSDQGAFLSSAIFILSQVCIFIQLLSMMLPAVTGSGSPDNDDPACPTSPKSFGLVSMTYSEVVDVVKIGVSAERTQSLTLDDQVEFVNAQLQLIAGEAGGSAVQVHAGSLQTATTLAIASSVLIVILVLLGYHVSLGRSLARGKLYHVVLLCVLPAVSAMCLAISISEFSHSNAKDGFCAWYLWAVEGAECGYSAGFWLTPVVLALTILAALVAGLGWPAIATYNECPGYGENVNMALLQHVLQTSNQQTSYSQLPTNNEL